MKVIIIPLNTDNYGYLVINEETNECIIVDVSNQPETIMSIMADKQLTLTTVLTTHKHWDHAGGNNHILKSIPNVQVVGSAVDSVEGCTNFVKDGEEFTVNGIMIKCILTPGHTMGHMCYYCVKDDQKIVFTGDCLFVGGAGKFFEGTGSDMYGSLYDKLGSLPPETLVYCGHEYTLSNYKFALSCEPDNLHLIAANEEASQLRQRGEPTIPSSLEKERLTNPFLRVLFPTVRALFPGLEDAAAVLAAVREAKNKF